MIILKFNFFGCCYLIKYCKIIFCTLCENELSTDVFKMYLKFSKLIKGVPQNLDIYYCYYLTCLQISLLCLDEFIF